MSHFKFGLVRVLLLVALAALLARRARSASSSYYSSEEDPNSLRNDPITIQSAHEPPPLASSDPNQEFWEVMHQNTRFSDKKSYSVRNDDKVCLTCPIDREIFTNLYQEAAANTPGFSQKLVPAPQRVSISWATEPSENRLIFFCRNNTKITSGPVALNSDYDAQGGSSGGQDRGVSDTQLDYTCENNRLCLLNAKKSYPHIYKCYVKSYVLNVNLNVIGKIFEKL